jgi:hypothetical protein
MIKTRKWNILDELKTEEDIYYYLLVAKNGNPGCEETPEETEYYYQKALKDVEQARIINNIPEPVSYEYNFNEFEPENSKELVYA